MKYKFKIRQAINMQFYFVIVARNHRIIATSETYKRRAGVNKAMRVIDPENKVPRIDETMY